jgi:rhamnogalacturonyl hydrolase YesR/tRNA A-37 threonylcarbamoyl transferase component Bud32
MATTDETPHRAADRELVTQVSAALERHGGGWQVAAGDGQWCMVTPDGYPHAEQGWKLHVSATPLSAMLVLSRSAEVLVRNGCAFKFAATLATVGHLVSPECPRGSGGKFITAYPRDDAHFRTVAEELHLVTEHLPGPGVLSDRAYRPGSLVSYRYGAFSGVTVLGNDGSYQTMLRAPDGGLVADTRNAWYAPPAWATCPVPVQTPAASGVPKAVLLADRFEVREAIRHSVKGGVFRAVDRSDGTDVVLKQARPHMVALLDGSDGRDALRNEAEMLDLLGPTGYVPRRLALFTQQDNLFLAEEAITGRTLSTWLHERVQRGLDGPGGAVFALPLAEVVDVLRRLAGVLSAVHERGIVLRDLSPSNILVTDDAALRLVDLEYACRPGVPTAPVGTPGFMAPEQVPDGTAFGPAPDQSVDRYALGCLAYYLAVGVRLGDLDRPRLERLVALAGLRNATLCRLAPLVLGLCQEAPAERWSLDQVSTFLAAVEHSTMDEAGSGDRLGTADQERLLRDGLAELRATMRPDDPGRLWPVPSRVEDSDTCNVEHGAAGTLAVLTRAWSVAGDGELHEAVRAAAGWLDRRLPAEPKTLPGLYFGRAGAAWALFDAAQRLGDERLSRRAITFAYQLPTRWPNPDVCHGSAGAGLACLYLAGATGDERLVGKVTECADHLVAVAERRRDGVFWPIPRDFDSTLAGLTHYGFGHGVAGIGCFLLAAGQATGDERYLELAQAAGSTLLRAARRPGDAAWWPVGEEADPANPYRMAHWCSGSSGVGTFLLRLWRFTKDPAYQELVEAAAVAVRRVKWQVTTTACHGLAGDGQFLLDLAEALGDERYRHWAEELACCLYAHAVDRDGRLVVPEEDGRSFHPGYQTGLAGVLDFLLRLRYGGSRSWLPIGELR